MATSLSRYFLSFDLLISLLQPLSFKGGNHHVLLSSDLGSLNCWISWCSVYSSGNFPSFPFLVSFFNLEFSGYFWDLLVFLLCKISGLMQNGTTCSWCCWAPALVFSANRYFSLLSDSISLCVFLISCTLTVTKNFYVRECNLHCKSLLLPVPRNIVSTSHREWFALIFLAVLMLLIWSLIIPYNNCFSSCVSALI